MVSRPDIRPDPSEDDELLRELMHLAAVLLARQVVLHVEQEWGEDATRHPEGPEYGSAERPDEP